MNCNKLQVIEDIRENYTEEERLYIIIESLDYLINDAEYKRESNEDISNHNKLISAHLKLQEIKNEVLKWGLKVKEKRTSLQSLAIG